MKETNRTKVGTQVGIASPELGVEKAHAPTRRSSLGRPLTYLTASEERVLRMTRGIELETDARLERVGQHHPEARAALLAIEARAFAHLRGQASPVKAHIIEKLRRM